MPHPRGENLSGIRWYLVKRFGTLSPHFVAGAIFPCSTRRHGAMMSNVTAPGCHASAMSMS
jgi:hypothetical protein